jgi:hypothetical protein
MSWPGSILPAGARVPRRRRGKGGKRTRPTSTERLMVKTARALGIAPKPRKTTTAVPRCVDHAFEMLGFATAWDLARFIEALAARSPGKLGNVRLPQWKVPEGVRSVVAIRCQACKGRGCSRCDQYGFGILLKVAIKKTKCARHEAAPPTAA